MQREIIVGTINTQISMHHRRKSGTFLIMQLPTNVGVCFPRLTGALDLKCGAQIEFWSKSTRRQFWPMALREFQHSQGSMANPTHFVIPIKRHQLQSILFVGIVVGDVRIFLGVRYPQRFPPCHRTTTRTSSSDSCPSGARRLSSS